MLPTEEKFKRYLQSKGLKFTPERQAVLDCVFASEKHFEAEELLMDLRQRDSRISKATIYRTLALLVKGGLLREVIFGEKHAHYEHVHDHEHHDHLVCSGCGNIIEFTDDRIEKLQDEVCNKHKFKAITHRLQITGLCKDCTSAGLIGE
ncbi:MAG: Fur family transcriptional regulator [Candidatus Brocadiales bacterium]